MINKLNLTNPDELLINWLASENEIHLGKLPIEPPNLSSEENPPILIPTQTYKDYAKSYSSDFNQEDLIPEVSQWPKEKKPFTLEQHLLAWYQPMHFYGGNWGIYVLKSGLEEIMQSVASYCSQIEMTTNPKFKSEIRFAAWQLLLLHEEFHHKVEMIAIRSAVASRNHSYRNYSHNVYSATKVSSPLSCREEALCDAYVFRNISKKLTKKVSKEIKSASKEAWIDHMSSAVGPYAGSLNLISKSSFSNTIHGLIDQVISGTVSPKASSLDWGVFPEFLNSLPNLKENTYLVEDLSSAANVGNSIFLALPTRKLQKVISMYGYSKSDEGAGSHEKWKKAGSPFIILTNSREQRISVIKSTAKTLGMNVDELARVTRNL
jgi:hypothetical protein